MKIKQKKQKIKFESKLSDEVMGLTHLDPNAIINKLEDNIKLREMPIERRLKKNDLSKDLNML